MNSVYPVFFVMENVPSVADRAELAAALSTLRGRYRVWQGVLNAASYGLPQSRQRVLVIGYRHDTGVTPTGPPPTHAGRRKIWDYRTETFVEPSPDTLDALLGCRAAAGRAAGRAVHHAGLLPGRRSGLWRGSSRSARRSAIWKKTPMARDRGTRARSAPASMWWPTMSRGITARIWSSDCAR